MPTKNKNIVRRSIPRTVRRHTKLALVPHAANQFRPHLVRRHGLVAVLLLIIAVQFIGNSTISQTVLGDKAPVTSAELLTLTNDTRDQAGLLPLALDQKLSDAAYLKAQDMIARQYWAHNAPDGTQPWKWLGDVQYNYSYAGENLAKNFASSQSVMSAWLDSQTHKDNILKPQYQDVGFAVVDGTIDGRPTSVVVALYAAPATTAVQGASNFVAPIAPTDVISRLGVAVQSASPAVIGSVIILLFTALIALITHANRHRMPRQLKQTWYRHHGAYKAIGLTSLIFVVIAYSNSGQI